MEGAAKCPFYCETIAYHDTETGASVGRPLVHGFFIHMITEAIPGKLLVAHRAFEANLTLIHRDHFPISLAGTGLDIDSLAHLEVYGPEKGHRETIILHLSNTS